MLVTLTITLYASTLPINNFTSDMLQERFGLSAVEAGDMFGYIYAISSIVLIAVGYCADRHGNLAVM
jgi:hypothetical protein